MHEPREAVRFQVADVAVGVLDAVAVPAGGAAGGAGAVLGTVGCRMDRKYLQILSPREQVEKQRIHCDGKGMAKRFSVATLLNSPLPKDHRDEEDFEHDFEHTRPGLERVWVAPSGDSKFWCSDMDSFEKAVDEDDEDYLTRLRGLLPPSSSVLQAAEADEDLPNLQKKPLEQVDVCLPVLRLGDAVVTAMVPRGAGSHVMFGRDFSLPSVGAGKELDEGRWVSSCSDGWEPNGMEADVVSQGILYAFGRALEAVAGPYLLSVAVHSVRKKEKLQNVSRAHHVLMSRSLGAADPLSGGSSAGHAVAVRRFLSEEEEHDARSDLQALPTSSPSFLLASALKRLSQASQCPRSGWDENPVLAKCTPDVQELLQDILRVCLVKVHGAGGKNYGFIEALRCVKGLGLNQEAGLAAGDEEASVDAPLDAGAVSSSLLLGRTTGADGPASLVGSGTFVSVDLAILSSPSEASQMAGFPSTRGLCRELGHARGFESGLPSFPSAARLQVVPSDATQLHPHFFWSEVASCAFRLRFTQA